MNENSIRKYPTKSDIRAKLAANLGNSFCNRCIIEKYGKLDSLNENKYDKNTLFMLVPLKMNYTSEPTRYLKDSFDFRALNIKEENEFCHGLYKEYSIYEILGWHDAYYKMGTESKSRKSSRKLSIRESYEDDLIIDMWYGDEFNTDDYAVSCTFYPNDAIYRGNIYRLSDGKIVGDYSCSDSVRIARELGYDFD